MSQTRPRTYEIRSVDIALAIKRRYRARDPRAVASAASRRSTRSGRGARRVARFVARVRS
jgi:hypothetical protein